MTDRCQKNEIYFVSDIKQHLNDLGTSDARHRRYIQGTVVNLRIGRAGS